MPDIARLWQLVRHHPWYVLLPALVFLVSGIVPIAQSTPQYRVAITFVLTSNAPMNDTGDTLAYDFPAVSRGQDFRQRVNAILDERAIMIADGASFLNVGNQDREVTIAAIGPDPTHLVAVRDAALTVLERDGTLLWGKSGDTAVNIAPLSRIDTPELLNPWVDTIAQLVLRTLAGALVGILVAVYRHTP